MSEQTYEPQTAPGTIGWNEIMTSDKAGSLAFYTQLFGWSSEDMELPGGMTYTMYKQGDRVVAGSVVSDCCETQPMWLNYINVANLNQSVAKAKELGGTICQERVDLPMGSFAVVADPQGAVFAFWEVNPEADCPTSC